MEGSDDTQGTAGTVRKRAQTICLIKFIPYNNIYEFLSFSFSSLSQMFFLNKFIHLSFKNVSFAGISFTRVGEILTVVEPSVCTRLSAVIQATSLKDMAPRFFRR